MPPDFAFVRPLMLADPDWADTSEHEILWVAAPWPAVYPLSYTSTRLTLPTRIELVPDFAFSLHSSLLFARVLLDVNTRYPLILFTVFDVLEP